MHLFAFCIPQMEPKLRQCFELTLPAGFCNCETSNPVDRRCVHKKLEGIGNTALHVGHGAALEMLGAPSSLSFT